MEYLEFLVDELPFFEAFSIPTEEDGMTRVGKRGKGIGPFYLLDRRIRGEDAGSLQHHQPKEVSAVWKMHLSVRQAAINRWQTAILQDLVAEIRENGREFNSARERSYIW
jgi:hypothetical protein